MKKKVLIFVLSGILFGGIGPACKKQSTLLPDLVVDDISCLGGNIYVTVKNQGEGTLPDNWISLASLYLDGVVQEDILLNRPSFTSGEGIAEPNGLSGYLLPFDVSAPVRVDVYLDYNSEIREANEDNNKKESVYIGPCLLPDLRVQDIYLDENSQVIVTVENIGPGTFPLNAWLDGRGPECTLRVTKDDEEFCRRKLIEFDPDKELAPVTGMAVFPTGLVVTDEATVTAAIDCSDLISEQNEENNVKTVILK